MNSRPRAATLAVLALASCTRPTGKTDDLSASKGLAPIPALVLGPELNGARVEESRSGPWAVRRTGSSPPVGTRGEGIALGAAPAPASPVSDAGAAVESARFALAGGGGVTADRAITTLPVTPASAAPHKPGEAPAESTALSEPAATALPLRAGSTDDNAAFAEFLRFLEGETPKLGAQVQPLDVRGRRFVRVLDASGRPVPAARVLVTDVAADRVLGMATTYGDGRAPWYPGLDSAQGSAQGEIVVQVAANGARKRVPWTGQDEELVVRLDEMKADPGPVQLDVCFLIDTTGSMGDEIAAIKSSLLAVTAKLRGLEREFSLRYGAVLYRDLGDEYVTMSHPFTSDIASFDEALKSVAAAGGGDGPESLNQGLAAAVGGLDWKDGAAKVVFLIADAPPHMDYAGDSKYGESLRAALARGIRIHAVAASGLDEAGTYVFRQIAQLTRGKFIFIEYGSAAESAAAHRVAGKVDSNNLDSIIYEAIRDEVARWGRAA